MLKSLKGFSLIEIMIVLALSSSLLLSGFYLLQHSSTLYHSQQQRLHSYATERYVQYRLSKSIRMAGFLPCSTLNKQSPTLSAITSTPPPAWLQTPIPNNDILKINFANPKISYLTQAMHTAHSPLQMSPTLTRQKKQLLILTDCHRFEFFTHSKPLQHTYPKHSALSFLQTQWFYLRQSTDGTDTALFMRDQTGRSEELIEGVTQFKALLSIDGQHFIVSNNTQMWRNAIAVKIEIHYKNSLSQDFSVRLRNI